MESTPLNSDPLQFDRVEPARAGAAVGAMCVACGQPITQTYYEIGGRIFCEQCKVGVVAALRGGSRFARFARALFLGLVAAAICSAGWLMVVKLTGYVIGLIAIVVGAVVGLAVRKGAGNRGGWVYQAMAIVLTYLAIATSYVPDVINAMTEGHAEWESTLVKSDKERSRITIQRDGRVILNDQESTPEEIITELERLKAVDGFVMYYREGRDELDPPASADVIGNKWAELELTVVPAKDRQFQEVDRGLISLGNATFVGKVMLVGWGLWFAIQVPFLNLQTSPINLLIIGFALWEAWKINKRPNIYISGPHALSPQTSAEGGASSQTALDYNLGGPFAS